MLTDYGFFAYNGNYDTDSDFFELDPAPWSLSIADEQDGDSFGFSDNGIDAPDGYVEGQAISGSLTFNDKSLADLGLSNGQSATFISDSGNNTVYMSAVQVPEVSTYALGLGLAAIGCAFLRRRVRR